MLTGDKNARLREYGILTLTPIIQRIVTIFFPILPVFVPALPHSHILPTAMTESNHVFKLGDKNFYCVHHTPGPVGRCLRGYNF